MARCGGGGGGGAEPAADRDAAQRRLAGCEGSPRVGADKIPGGGNHSSITSSESTGRCGTGPPMKVGLHRSRWRPRRERTGTQGLKGPVRSGLITQQPWPSEPPRTEVIPTYNLTGHDNRLTGPFGGCQPSRKADGDSRDRLRPPLARPPPRGNLPPRSRQARRSHPQPHRSARVHRCQGTPSSMVRRSG